MTLVLDAGALVALERNDLAMWQRFNVELHARRVPVTHGGVVAQVWRGGDGRQARLAIALASIDVVALDDRLARVAGLLLGQARMTDAVDAAVVALASSDDRIVTSDPGDIRPLIQASGRSIGVIRV